MKYWTQLGALAVVALSLVRGTYAATNDIPKRAVTGIVALYKDGLEVPNQFFGFSECWDIGSLFTGNNKEHARELDKTTSEIKDFKFISGHVLSIDLNNKQFSLEDSGSIISDDLEPLVFKDGCGTGSPLTLMLEPGEMDIPADIASLLELSFVMQFTVIGNKGYGLDAKCRKNGNIIVCYQHIGEETTDHSGCDVYQLISLKGTLADHLYPPRILELSIAQDGHTYVDGAEIALDPPSHIGLFLDSLIPNFSATSEEAHFKSDESALNNPKVTLLSGVVIDVTDTDIKVFRSVLDGDYTPLTPHLSRYGTNYLFQLDLGDQTIFIRLPYSEKLEEARAVQFSGFPTGNFPEGRTFLVNTASTIILDKVLKKVFILTHDRPLGDLFDPDLTNVVSVAKSTVEEPVSLPKTRSLDFEQVIDADTAVEPVVTSASAELRGYGWKIGDTSYYFKITHDRGYLFEEDDEGIPWNLQHSAPESVNFKFVSGHVLSIAKGSNHCFLKGEPLDLEEVESIELEPVDADCPIDLKFEDGTIVKIPEKHRENLHVKSVIQFSVPGVHGYTPGRTCFKTKNEQFIVCRMHVNDGSTHDYDVYQLISLEGSLAEHFYSPLALQVSIGLNGVTAPALDEVEFDEDMDWKPLVEAVKLGGISDDDQQFEVGADVGNDLKVDLLSGANIKAAGTAFTVKSDIKELTWMDEPKLFVSKYDGDFFVFIGSGNIEVFIRLPRWDWDDGLMAQFANVPTDGFPDGRTLVQVDSVTIILDKDLKKVFISYDKPLYNLVDPDVADIESSEESSPNESSPPSSTPVTLSTVPATFPLTSQLHDTDIIHDPGVTDTYAALFTCGFQIGETFRHLHPNQVGPLARVFSGSETNWKYDLKTGPTDNAMNYKFVSGHIVNVAKDGAVKFALKGKPIQPTVLDTLGFENAPGSNTGYSMVLEKGRVQIPKESVRILALFFALQFSEPGNRGYGALPKCHDLNNIRVCYQHIGSSASAADGFDVYQLISMAGTLDKHFSHVELAIGRSGVTFPDWPTILFKEASGFQSLLGSLKSTKRTDVTFLSVENNLGSHQFYLQLCTGAYIWGKKEGVTVQGCTEEFNGASSDFKFCKDKYGYILSMEAAGKDVSVHLPWTDALDTAHVAQFASLPTVSFPSGKTYLQQGDVLVVLDQLQRKLYISSETKTLGTLFNPSLPDRNLLTYRIFFMSGTGKAVTAAGIVLIATIGYCGYVALSPKSDSSGSTGGAPDASSTGRYPVGPPELGTDAEIDVSVLDPTDPAFRNVPRVSDPDQSAESTYILPDHTLIQEEATAITVLTSASFALVISVALLI